MQLNNPIFINQTDADTRYINATGDSLNGVLNTTGLIVSGLGTSFILKSPGNYNSVYFDPTSNGNAGVLNTNYINAITMYSVGDQDLTFSYGGGGTKSIVFRGYNGSVANSYALIDSKGNFGIGSGISEVPSSAKLFVSGNLAVSGSSSFSIRPTVNGTGILLSGEGGGGSVTLPNDILYASGTQTISGSKTFTSTGIFNSGIDLNNSNLINATPQMVNVSANFNISGNHNSRVILGGSSSLITGTIVNGNPLGFNTSIIQIGNGQIQITGQAGVSINEYADQYKTAGIYATISLLHTGNNGYIMYGNTAP